MKKTNHRIWHKFVEFMEKNFREDWEKGTIHGYEAIVKIQKYADENKKIKIVNCDDSVFASSIIVIIPTTNMGNHIMFVPQCTHQTNIFFLYPHHQKNLIKVLNKLTYDDIDE